MFPWLDRLNPLFDEIFRPNPIHPVRIGFNQLADLRGIVGFIDAENLGQILRWTDRYQDPVGLLLG